jgi:phosphate uptake regulator
MKRKLIKQGKGALTLSLPKDWIDFNELKYGQEINIYEEDNKLIIQATETKRIKETSINLDYQTHEDYRNIIATLYRGGYDVINVNFSDKRVIPKLQKVMESLYGFEIFSIKKNSCIIKSIYVEEFRDIKTYLRRMIYNIQNMQEIINEDIKKKKFSSKEEIIDSRNNILKQRDLIMRIIKVQKLVDNKHFPYYSIVSSLWAIARNYYHLYLNLNNKMNISKKELELLKETEEYFNFSFSSFNSDIKILFKRNENYRKLRDEVLDFLKTNKKPSLIISFCLDIIFSIQSSDSFVYLISHKD